MLSINGHEGGQYMAISKLVFCPVSSKQSSALAMHVVNFSKQARSINDDSIKTL